MTSLPPDVLRLLVRDSTHFTLMNMCLVSKRFNMVLCQADNIWKNKLQKEYGNYLELKGQHTYQNFYYLNLMADKILNLSSAELGTLLENVLLDYVNFQLTDYKRLLLGLLSLSYVEVLDTTIAAIQNELVVMGFRTTIDQTAVPTGLSVFIHNLNGWRKFNPI